MQQIIVSTLYLMTALIPLIFTTETSELFEFPKFLVLLAGSVTIAIAWIMHAVLRRDYSIIPNQRLGTNHQLIHWSVIAILVTQAVATVFSIHPYTSFWGYYSRFHQGLLTTICYTIVYFAAVKWLDKKSTQKLIHISVKTAFILSIIAILEHFDISITCMVITVLGHFQNAAEPFIANTTCWGANTNPIYRSFATLGQPNWLAAYLVPHIFLSLYLAPISIQKIAKSAVAPLLVFITLFVALLATKSRSGFIAFGLSYIAYWLLMIRSHTLGEFKRQVIFPTLMLLIAILLFGSPYSPSLAEIISQKPSPTEMTNTTSGTILETGGTESGDIRKIVWGGALSLISHHPFIGTGPETFAYTYYWERPVTHNYTSEWDFLYNKAHNEYLNIAATSGILGVGAYILWHYAVILASFTHVAKSGKKARVEDEESERKLYPVLAGTIITFGVTNFFGFSVIPVYLLMTIIASLPSTIIREPIRYSELKESRYWLVGFLIIAGLMIPLRLYLADRHFANARATNNSRELEQAIKLRPQEDLYHSLLAELYAAEVGQNGVTVEEVEAEAALTRSHNPYHLNYFKSRAKVYLTLAAQDSKYYVAAAEELIRARELAPSDPKLAYNLGLVYSRLGDITKAESQMNQAIELKKNYQDAYYALTLIYEQTDGTGKIPQLLQTARENLATYSGLLQEKMDKYPMTIRE